MEDIKVVYLASKTISKIKAVETVFNNAKVKTFDIPSFVPGQPFGEEETFKGAHNRIFGLYEKVDTDDTPDIFISIESGVMRIGPDIWVDRSVIIMRDKNGNEVVGTTPGIMTSVGLSLDFDEYKKRLEERGTPDVSSYFTDGQVTRSDNIAFTLKTMYYQLGKKI